MSAVVNVLAFVGGLSVASFVVVAWVWASNEWAAARRRRAHARTIGRWVGRTPRRSTAHIEIKANTEGFQRAVKKAAASFQEFDKAFRGRFR